MSSHVDFFDEYLTLVIELYENGTWSKEVAEKRTKLYAKEKKIDDAVIEDFFNRLFKVKEYTIDEKRKFLAYLKFDDGEEKYGKAALTMSEAMVLKFYDIETSSLDMNAIKMYHSMASVNFHSEESVFDIPEEIINTKDNNNGDNFFVRAGNLTDNETTNSVLEEPKVQEDNFFNVAGNLTDENIAEDNASVLEKQKVQEDNFFSVAGDLTDENITEDNVPVLEEKKEESEIFNIPGDIDNSNVAQDDIPQTEEEFKNQAQNITGSEQDSNVTFVNATPERVENLKKNKGKVKNFFLKTAIVVTSVMLLSPSTSIALIGGYLYFANQIKEGRFNPTSKIGQVIKSTVEKVMYIGMNKGNINEEQRGRTI